MIEFQWTITLGQVISTAVILFATGLAYALFISMHSKAQARIAELEKQVAVLREELRVLSGLMKIGEALDG